MKKVIEISWYSNGERVTLRLTAESTSAAEVELAIEMLRSVYKLSDPSDVRVFYVDDLEI